MARSKNDTPIRKQYLEIKRQYPDTIVFFRLGSLTEDCLKELCLRLPNLERLRVDNCGSQLTDYSYLKHLTKLR